MYGKKHSDETKKAIFKNEQISWPCRYFWFNRGAR
jgi:hypothetical protein